MVRPSHCNDQTIKATNSAAATDSGTSSGVALARDRTQTQTRITMETPGQHTHIFPLAMTMPWTHPPPFVRPPPRRIRKNIARLADASNAVSKATLCRPVRVRNLDKTKTPTWSLSKTTRLTICLSIAVATRASRLPRSLHWQCAFPTKEKECSPESSKRWEPMWVFRTPECFGSCSGYRYRFSVLR